MILENLGIKITGNVKSDNLKKVEEILRFYDFWVCYIDDSSQRALARASNKSDELKLKDLGVVKFSKL